MSLVVEVVGLTFAAIRAVIRVFEEVKANKRVTHELHESWTNLLESLEQLDDLGRIGETHVAPLKRLRALADETAALLKRLDAQSRLAAIKSYKQNHSALVDLGARLVKRVDELNLSVAIDGAALTLKMSDGLVDDLLEIRSQLDEVAMTTKGMREDADAIKKSVHESTDAIKRGVQENADAIKVITGLLENDAKPAAENARARARAKLRIAESEVKVDGGKPLGAGGFGTVRRATWLGTPVVVKQVQVDDARALKAMLHELDVLVNLRHPQVIRLFGMVEQLNQVWAVLELAEHGSLHHVLHGLGQAERDAALRDVSALGSLPGPGGAFLRIAAEVACGLAYLHGKRVVHGDIKSANVLVCAGGHAKLADFGLAKISTTLRTAGMSQASTAPAAQMHGGTAGFMAPEMVSGKAPSGMADVFALGIVLSHMLTGVPPFAECHNELQIGFAIVRGDRPQLPAETPLPIAELVGRCVQQKPIDRPTAANVHRSLVVLLCEAEGREAAAREPEKAAHSLLDALQEEGDDDGWSAGPTASSSAEAGVAAAVTVAAAAVAAPGGVPLESLNADEARELLAHLRVRAGGEVLDGARLKLLDRKSLGELDPSLDSPRRDAALARLGELARGGVPVPLMAMVRATVARVRAEASHAEMLEREDLQRKIAAERQVRAWLATKGWGDELLTASAVDMRARGLTDADVRSIVLLLEVNTDLCSLDLSDNRLGDEGAIGLGSALIANASLRVLNLHGNRIGDKGVAGLCDGLRANRTLEYLELDANALTDASAPTLAAMLKTNGSLTELDAFRNDLLNVSKAAIKAAWLARAGRDASRLGLGRLQREHEQRLERERQQRQQREEAERLERERQQRQQREEAKQLDVWLGQNGGGTSMRTAVRIDLQSKGLTHQDMPYIVLLLKVNASLTTLWLNRNQIADKGAIGLAEGLKVNASLTKLYLSDNKIANAGAIALGKALEVNASLTMLDLDYNQIADAGAIGLGKALEVNASLTVLGLGNNKIADAGAVALGKALAVNASLTYLSLWANQVGDKGAIGLAEGLKVNASLTELYLSSNQIADKGAIGLAEGLKVNASLTELYLHENQIADAGAIGLGKALEVNASLTTLLLNTNQFGEASKSAIKTAWLSKPGRGKSNLWIR